MSEETSVGRTYKRLLSYVWPHKAAFSVAILGYIIFASASPMMAHMMGWVSETLDAPTHDNILLLVLTLLGIFLYRGIGTFLGKFFIAVVGRNVVHSMQPHMGVIFAFEFADLRELSERFDVQFELESRTQ